MISGSSPPTPTAANRAPARPCRSSRPRARCSAARRAADLAASSATLHARVNPEGLPTAYRFEYGTTSAYGTSVPVPDGEIPAGTSAVTVTSTSKVSAPTPPTTGVSSRATRTGPPAPPPSTTRSSMTRRARACLMAAPMRWSSAAEERRAARRCHVRRPGYRYRGGWVACDRLCHPVLRRCRVMQRPSR